MQKKDILLSTYDQEKINITAFGTDNFNSAPCLIIVHGFRGFKDWGFYPYIAKYFALLGYFVITFNFSYNGIGDNPLELTEPERFARNTYSREISELSRVIDAYKNGFFGNAGKNKIGLLGHSRGGAVSILTAANRSGISAIASWAGLSHVDRYTARQKEQWRKDGALLAHKMRKGNSMLLNVSMLDDIEKNKNSSLNIQKAVEKLTCPLLIAQGDQDLSVPVKEAEELYGWSGKELSELFILKAAGHTFNIKHPFEGTNPKLEELLGKTAEFFNKHLMET